MQLPFELTWRRRVSRSKHALAVCSEDPTLVDPSFTSLGLPALPIVLHPKINSLVTNHISRIHQLPWKSGPGVFLKAHPLLSGLLG